MLCFWELASPKLMQDCPSFFHFVMFLLLLFFWTTGLMLTLMVISDEKSGLGPAWLKTLCCVGADLHLHCSFSFPQTVNYFLNPHSYCRHSQTTMSCSPLSHHAGWDSLLSSCLRIVGLSRLRPTDEPPPQHCRPGAVLGGRPVRLFCGASFRWNWMFLALCSSWRDILLELHGERKTRRFSLSVDFL